MKISMRKVREILFITRYKLQVLYVIYTFERLLSVVNAEKQNGCTIYSKMICKMLAQVLLVLVNNKDYIHIVL
jgi:hypothetical protein